MTDLIITILYNRQLIYHLILLVHRTRESIKKIFAFYSIHQLSYITHFLKE